MDIITKRKLFRFFIEYETGLQERKEQIIIAANALDAIGVIIDREKSSNLRNWLEHPTGMISVRAKLPTE